MIDVQQLVKRYEDLANGPTYAVNGLSFVAQSGEILGLLGPNGAGKTTTLRILSTMLRPTGGAATVEGFDVVEHPEEVRRRIGFVSANTAVYDRMTAAEMVQFFGRLNGLDGEQLQHRMQEIFTQLKMLDIRNTLGAKMSTGMRQKVSIARALIHDPAVLIFDEATSGLDVLSARALLQTISRLRDHGKCILFSTHIMGEVEKLCDRVAIMHHGELLCCGRLNELLTAYRQPDMEELFFSLITARSTLTA